MMMHWYSWRDAKSALMPMPLAEGVRVCEMAKQCAGH
jgi:hypothetical protein